jgi:hypothetical protein
LSCDKGSKHVLITHNGTFTKRVKCERPTACSEGTCLGPTHLHLSRRADYALVQTQLASRKGDLPLEPIVEDAARHRPMYGAHYGSNYITRQNDGPSWSSFPSPAGVVGSPRDGVPFRDRTCDARNPKSTAPEEDCRCLPWEEWRGCLVERLHSYGLRLRAASPYLILSGDITDYIARRNLKEEASFPGVCRPGTVGRWGEGTCVPDLAGSPEAPEQPPPIHLSSNEMRPQRQPHHIHSRTLARSLSFPPLSCLRQHGVTESLSFT